MRHLVLIPSALAFVLVVQPAFAASPGDKAVLAALDTWKQAMLSQDRAALEKIFHPDLSYGYPSAIRSHQGRGDTAHRGWRRLGGDRARRHDGPRAGQRGHRQWQDRDAQPQQGPGDDDQQGSSS
jgi:hypothetical protein